MSKKLMVSVADKVHEYIEKAWKEKQCTRSEFVEELIRDGIYVREKRIGNDGILN